MGNKLINTDVMQDASEIVHYENPDIPLYIRTGLLSRYPDMKALCHWHEDIELISILEGEMFYNINGKILLLKEGDSLIVNSRNLHYGYARQRHECRFICILFHPRLLAANESIYHTWVRPIIENRGIEFLPFEAGAPDSQPVTELILRIHAAKESARNTFSYQVKPMAAGCEPDTVGSELEATGHKLEATGYELEAISCLYLLWQKLFFRCQSLLDQNAVSDSSEVTLQKKMVSYLYEHYQEPVTLDEVAAAGSVSRSKCCQIFRRYLQQSPIDFLNKYRLEVSCYLLANTDSSISQAAVSCGFNHLSYFSKMFLREYGCTPSEYRKKSRD